MSQSHATTVTLTEHFGYMPLSFIDDVINAMNDLIYQTAGSLETFLRALGQYAVDDALTDEKFQEEVDHGLHQFETLLESTVDKYFDMFELYALQNLFIVPEDTPILLKHYVGLDFSIDKSQEDNLDKELELVRKKILATLKMQHLMKKEIARTEQRLVQYENYYNQVFSMSIIAKEHNVNALPDMLHVIIDQLSAVKSLVDVLRKQVDDEKLQHYADGTDQTMDERSKYVKMIVCKQTAS